MKNQTQAQTATVHQLPLPRLTSALIDGAVTCDDITRQYELILNAMNTVMKEDEHYGTIPGCGPKKTLLKPGAEVLMTLFGLTNDIDVQRFDMQNDHREVECKVTIFAPNGRRLGTGVGSCSTMESKYRFRTGPMELTDKLVPREYWDLRNSDPEQALEIIGGKGFVVKKGDDNKWYVAMQGEQVENDNPANQYNTVLKMSSKRALIDAVLKSTAASFLFTQDLEDMLENGVIYIAPSKNKNKKDGKKYQNAENYPPSGNNSPESQTGSGDGNNGLFDDKTGTPDQVLVALQRKGLNFTANDQTGEIFVKLDYSDSSNRQFVSGLGFKWDKSNKYWHFKP